MRKRLSALDFTTSNKEGQKLVGTWDNGKQEIVCYVKRFSITNSESRFMVSKSIVPQMEGSIYINPNHIRQDFLNYFS